jgi:hypothetical protein
MKKAQEEEKEIRVVVLEKGAEVGKLRPSLSLSLSLHTNSIGG